MRLKKTVAIMERKMMVVEGHTDSQQQVCMKTREYVNELHVHTSVFNLHKIPYLETILQ